MSNTIPQPLWPLKLDLFFYVVGVFLPFKCKKKKNQCILFVFQSLRFLFSSLDLSDTLSVSQVRSHTIQLKNRFKQKFHKHQQCPKGGGRSFYLELKSINAYLYLQRWLFSSVKHQEQFEWKGRKWKRQKEPKASRHNTVIGKLCKCVLESCYINGQYR